MIVTQGCDNQDVNKQKINEDYCMKLVEQYMNKSSLKCNNDILYFCVGIDVINGDTIFSMRGGNKEEYWSNIDQYGNYHKISPNVLYRAIDRNIITFYPANKDLSLWTQKIFGCKPINLNSIKSDTIKDINYDPTEITFRFNNELKTFEFQHYGLHNYNQPLKMQKEEWLEDLNDN